jgi:hypothetical protein
VIANTYKDVKQPKLYADQAASIDASQLLISSCWSPIVAGVALDLLGRRVVQLFHPAKAGGFIHLPLK